MKKRILVVDDEPAITRMIKLKLVDDESTAAGAQTRVNKPVKVLIVEDSEDDAKLALLALRRGGFEPTYRRVQTAAELETALAQERWDAVISDFQMPGFTGMDALRIFRSSGLDIPFILISGTIGEETAVDAMKAGASDYIMKKSLARLAPALERELKETQMRAAHRRAQADLTDSEKRFRQMAENIRDVFFLREAGSNRILYVSPAYEEIWGRSCESLYANPESWIEAIHPDDRASTYEKSKAGMLAGNAEFEYRIVRPDGSIRWIKLRGFPVRDAAGKIVRIAGVAEDITQRTQAAQELRESERRFSELLQNVELVSLMLDREARITYCNEYLLRLTGWRQEEVIGRNWFELFIPPEITDAKDAFAAVLANLPEAWHRENEILTRSGERRLIRWNCSVLRSGAGDVIGTASIGEDITEQKRAEIKIMHLNRVYAMLSGINTLIVRVRDRDELFREACRVAVENGQFRTAWIGVIDRSAMKIVQIASAGADSEFLSLIEDRFSLREDAPLGITMSARAVREKKAIVTNDIRDDPKVFFAKARIERGIFSMAILPLLVSDNAIGVLALYADETGIFDEEKLKLLTELAGDIAFAIDHIEKAEKLNYLAYYDVLTGLANRSLFLEWVALHMRSAVRRGHKLALFVIDLERFKNINDSLGQSAGDALLRQVAKWLTRNAVGDGNLVARVGADHFAVVLPEVKQEGNVVRLLEKWIEAFLEHPFHLNDAVFRLAFKVGVAPVS